MTPAVSLVLPCYNEAGNIASLVASYAPAAEAAGLELVLVDNGSTDGTAAALKAELARPGASFARSIRVPRNVGYGHGLKAGLAAASAPLLAVSHADLQYSPEEIVKALRHYRARRPAGPCLVKGRRVGPRPLADRCVTRAFNSLTRGLLGLEAVPAEGGGAPRAPDVNAEPKLFERALLADLESGPDDFTFDLYILEMARRRGWRILEFDAAYGARVWGSSKLAANPWVRLKTAARAFLKILELRGGGPVQPPAASR